MEYIDRYIFVSVIIFEIMPIMMVLNLKVITALQMLDMIPI